MDFSTPGELLLKPGWAVSRRVGMANESAPICFQCGQASGGPHLGTLSDGAPCPACLERFQEALPPLLPGLGRGLPAGYRGIGAEPRSESNLGRRAQEEPFEGGSFGSDDPIAG